MKAFFKVIDDNMLIRRAILLLIVYMCYDSYQWAKAYVASCKMGGAETGLIVAAVTVPISLLLKGLVELYNASRASKSLSEG